MKQQIFSWTLPLFAIAFLTTAMIVPDTSTEVRWYTMEEVAAIKAKNPKDTKMVFVDVYTDWCGWCKRMDATTFKDPSVMEVLSDKYYPVKFNAEQKSDITLGEKTYKFVASGRRGYHELAAALLQGKMSYPSFVFLDENMNMIQPLAGYRQTKEMLPILHYIGEKRYNDQGWQSFLKEWQGK